MADWFDENDPAKQDWFDANSPSPTAAELSTLEAPEGSSQRQDINRSVAGSLFETPGKYARDPTLAELIDASMPRSVQEAKLREKGIPMAPPLPEQGAFEQGGVYGVTMPAVEAGVELGGAMIPHDWESYLAQFYAPAAAYHVGKHLAEGDVSDIPLVGRVPEIMAAEETPAFSKERYLTTAKTLMDVGALAGASAEGPRIPMRVEPTLAERITSPRVEPSVPVEPPTAAPEMPATVPEPILGAQPGAVRPSAPYQTFQPDWFKAQEPSSPPVSPGAAKQLRRLKAHKAQVEAIGGKVDPDKVTAKIAEIEGVPQEAPVQAPEGGGIASEAPGGVQGAEPPQEPGTVRIYHGSSTAAGQAGTDFTTHQQYARDYAAKSEGTGGEGTVWYVDVPEGVVKTHDEYGQPMTRVVVPPEIAAQAKPLGEPPPPGAGEVVIPPRFRVVGSRGRGTHKPTSDYDIVTELSPEEYQHWVTTPEGEYPRLPKDVTDAAHAGHDVFIQVGDRAWKVEPHPVDEGQVVVERVSQNEQAILSGAEKPPPPGAGVVSGPSGEPITFYHGSGQKGIKTEELRSPVYLTPNIEHARGFSEQSGVFDEPLSGRLELKNPKVVKITPEQVKSGDYQLWAESSFVSPERMASLQKQGYDGIVARLPDGSVHEAVAFHPRQIKPKWSESQVSAELERQFKEHAVNPQKEYNQARAKADYEKLLKESGWTQDEISALSDKEFDASVGKAKQDALRTAPRGQAVEPPPPGAGAAPPPEVPPSERGYAGMEPLPTSTKNVVTAAERETRGLPPAEEAAARDFGTVWDESAKDTAAPARLVASLKVEPRALSDVENAHLLRRQIELQTEHDTMTKAVNEASDSAVAAEAKQRLETVRNDLQDVYDVGKAAGTETGRGLNARKMLADQDYALTNMEATTRALVNDGKPLSEAQLSEVAKLHERIRTAEDKLAAYESQEIFNQSLKAAPRRPVLSFLDEQAVKARERINARRTRLYADPLGITNVAHLADEAIIGASHIARGVTKFADWSAQMVSEFGDRIKPYLAALFEKSKQQFKNASAGLKKAPVTYAEREARALAGEKKGIITRTEKLIGRTEVIEAGHPFGEFEPLKRRAPRMDPEKARLQYEYSKAKEAFDRGIYEAELKKRSRPERILGTAREVLNLPRSLLASADFSAVRRQGGIYTMIHPLRARHAFRAMLEATKSEQGYFKVTQEIKDRPNAPEYQRYGLELTDIGPVTRAKMEEQFQSRWAGKIPGISHSQRAYTAFLNHARADWFDLLKDSLAKKGEPLTPKQGKAIANAVNVFTGRGAMNQKWIGAMTALNDVFFAPRWRASRFQTLIGQPLWKNSGARGVIAKEYAKALIGYGSILTLIGWATKNTLHPMEKNPVSTEAGKLRVGNTRIDFLQGLQQPTVLLSRLFSGRTKTAAGEVQKIYGDVPLGKTTSSDIITRFLRSSLAPVPGGIWNVLEQKNVIGEPVTLPSTVRDLTIPLLGKDIYDAMKEQGVPTGTALGLLALFGDGIQTYSPRVSTKAPKREPTVSQRIKAAKAKRTRERKKGLQGQMTP